MSDPKISSDIETAMENVTNVLYPKIYGLTINNIKYFIEIINGNPINKGNIQEGLDVIKILEMATKSLKE